MRPTMAAHTSDVLVVGAGGAGVAAAIEAASRGARVTIVEAQPASGGAAVTAGGGCFAAGSPLQERLGIDDSPDRALEDWIAWGGEAVDVEWARRYVEGSASEVYGWLTGLGVGWVGVDLHEGNRAPRWHAPKGAGWAVVQALQRAAADLPIDWHYGTRVTEIAVAGGRVIGLQAEDADGPIEYRADAVLIASGGFNNNLEMVLRHAKNLAPGNRVLLGGGRGALGEGHGLLERLGAQLVNMDAVWMYPYSTPDYRDPSGRRGLVVRGLEGDVWVNRQARRFHDESRRGGATGLPALLAQDPPTCWSIIDATIASRYTVADPTYRRQGQPVREELYRLLDESPFIAKADTIEGLAAAAGLDPGTLRETLADHNRARTLGLETDPDFGRPLAGLEPLTEPPFYALQFFPLARKNLGGVRTDGECRAVRADGTPVPGLFAAGEVAGMAGGRINGRNALEGTMFGPSIFSGRIAGRVMAGARATTSR